MIPYDGWDREYKQNVGAYIELFDQFMNQTNYENNEDFERKVAYRFDRKHCVSVASATDALHFSLFAHGIGPGDEVLVTDFSWISSSSCVDMAGATPVFCDIDLNSYHMNMDSIRRMCSAKTKAIVYPHLFGNMTDTTDIQQFCRERGIVFIEDAAQSLGSSLNGVAAGTIGDSSVFSFNSNKVIAGINGGGVVLTDDDEVALRVKQIRRHGKDKTFDTLGYNSRMYVLNAKIIELRMQSMEQNQQRRQEIAQQYNTAFADLPVHTQTMTEGLNHNYHKYVVRFEDKLTRKRVKDALGASIHYETPLSLNGMYSGKVIRSDACANAKKAADTVISLPVHAWLTDDEVNLVKNSVKTAI